MQQKGALAPFLGIDEQLHHLNRDFILFGERFNLFRWRLVSNDQIDIGQCAEFDHRVAAKFTVVDREEDTAAIFDNRAFYAHFMVVEIKQRAVIIDATDPKMPKSKRNWEIKSNVASPVTPPSLLRTSPPPK